MTVSKMDRDCTGTHKVHVAKKKYIYIYTFNALTQHEDLEQGWKLASWLSPKYF